MLDIQPNTGFDQNQISMLIHCKVVFDQFYPYRAPLFSFVNKKGLEEEQYEQILDKFNSE